MEFGKVIARGLSAVALVSALASAQSAHAAAAASTFTFSFWFKMSDTTLSDPGWTGQSQSIGSYYQWWDAGHTGHSAVTVRLHEDGTTSLDTPFVFGSGPPIDLAVSNVDVVDDAFHNLAATYDGTQFEYFVDGVSQGTSTAIIWYGTVDSVIGLNEGLFIPGPETFDEVRLYDAALAASELRYDPTGGADPRASDLLFRESFDDGTADTAGWTYSTLWAADLHLGGKFGSGSTTSQAGLPYIGFSFGSPSIAVSPTTDSFGTIGTNTSGSHNYTVTNTGNLYLNVSSVSVTGTNANQYSANIGTCNNAVGPGLTCTVSVTFMPTSSGSKSATLHIASDASNNTDLTVALSGSGGAPGFSVSPTSYTYALTAFGSTKVQSFTVTNTGTTPLTVSTATLSGTNANQFSVSQGTCASAVAAGATCSLTATFAPTLASGAGSKTATLTIPNDAGSPVTVALNGTSAAALAAIPTLSEWGLIVMFVLLAATATLSIRRKHSNDT